MWPKSIKVRNEHGRLPLHEACCENAQNAGLIAMLIAEWPHAVRDACQKTGLLPLHLACKAQGSLAVLQLLVEAWSEAVLVPDEYGFLPLHYACKNVGGVSDTEQKQSLEKIKLLVEARPESLQIQTKLGMLPLHWACFDPVASTNVIRYLVESFPAAVFVQDHKGRLPLHLACAETAAGPPFEVIQCLVQAWPESIHILQGEDKSAAFMANFQGYSADLKKMCNREFDGLQALALDLVCKAVSSKQLSQPSTELLLLLTSQVPPLHFASAHAWIPTRLTTIQYLSSIYPSDRMHFHDGKLPFHNLCRAGVHSSVLRWWLEECPNAICAPTTDTGDYPLHCYLVSSTIITTTSNKTGLSIQQSLFWSTVIYLAEHYPGAISSTNRMGWHLLHLAVIRDAPLDVIFYLLCQSPEAVTRHHVDFQPF